VVEGIYYFKDYRDRYNNIPFLVVADVSKWNALMLMAKSWASSTGTTLSAAKSLLLPTTHNTIWTYFINVLFYAFIKNCINSYFKAK